MKSRTESAGFSLIELTIASILLTMMVFAVSTLSVRGGEAQEYARRLNRVTELTQDLLDEMRLELVSSVRVFGADAEGTANLALLDLTGSPTPLGGQRLPTIAPSEAPRPDTLGDEITGNSLFFAKLVWTDRFVCSSGEEYLVDVCRWIYYYLTPEEGGPDPSNPIGLNIVRIVSEPLVDAAAIDRIADATDQAELLVHLLNGTPDATGESHPPCEIVWQRGALPGALGTIRQIDLDGTLSDSPINGRNDPWDIQRRDAAVRGLLAYRHHSIASVYALPSFGVGRYALSSTGGSGFPHGLEVQVVGPSSARQVLLHLVVSSTARRGHFAWSDMQVSVDTRDL